MNPSLYAEWLAHPDHNRASIYFIRSGDYVKVGFSRNVATRLTTIRRSGGGAEYPADIDLGSAYIYGVVPGAPFGERLIHAVLAPHRACGEWFHWNEPVRDHLDMWLGLIPHAA